MFSIGCILFFCSFLSMIKDLKRFEKLLEVQDRCTYRSQNEVIFVNKTTFSLMCKHTIVRFLSRDFKKSCITIGCFGKKSRDHWFKGHLYNYVILITQGARADPILSRWVSCGYIKFNMADGEHILYFFNFSHVLLFLMHFWYSYDI